MERNQIKSKITLNSFFLLDTYRPVKSVEKKNQRSLNFIYGSLFVISFRIIGRNVLLIFRIHRLPLVIVC